MTSHSRDPFAAIAEMTRATKIASIENTAMQQARAALALTIDDRRLKAEAAVAWLKPAADQIARLREGRPQ